MLADKTKGDAHTVPLYRQAVAILSDLKPLTHRRRNVVQAFAVTLGTGLS